MSRAKGGLKGKNLPENKLAIVVARANELRNVLKLDKQSPFVTLRLQDQETSTRVLPRAGQTPRWDEAHWFSLDGIDLNQEKNRTISINVYHQKKGDAKLICCGDIDYTPALTQSISDGYDGWFDLFWDGRSAGKIFLEFTYYPKMGQVPIGTQSLGRSSQQQKQGQGSTAGVRKSMHVSGSVMKTNELPPLNNKNNNGGFNTDDDDDDIYSDIDGDGYDKKKANESNLTAASGDGGIFHFLDKKLQNLAGRFAGNGVHSSNEGWLSLGGGEEDYSDVKRKVESPALIKKAPRNLFGESISDDDEEEEEEEHQISSGLGNLKFNTSSSIAKRQERILKEAHVKSSDDEDYEDEEQQEFVMGQSVNFMNSTKTMEDLPPPPPKHTIPTNSLFESKKANVESRTEPELSWYERRMKSRHSKS